MRAFRFTAVLALVSACAVAIFVVPAGATVTPSFSATDVTTCGGTSHVTLTLQAQNPAPVQQAADIVLLVDGSGSIGGTATTGTFGSTVKTSLNTFVTNAAPSSAGNHVGIVEFSTTTATISPLSGDPTSLHGAIAAMPYPSGWTYTKDGLTAAEAMLAASSRPTAPKVIIVETDGVWQGPDLATTNAQNPTVLAQSLVTGGTTIFVVGVGTINTADLTAIAGGVSARVFNPSNYTGLDAALDTALTEIVPAAKNLSYDVVTAPGFSLVGTPTASVGSIAVTPGGFTWTDSSVNSPAGTIITISYDEQHTGATDGSLPLASTADLAYTDDANAAQTASYADQTVAVTGCNRPPVANAGPDQTVDLSGSPVANVTLDGTGSSDPDGNSLTYSWAEGSTVLGTGATPTVPLGIGPHTITLTVSDGQYSSTDDVVIDVVDPSPPTVTPNVTGTQHNGWYTSDATVSFIVSDPESAISSESADCAGTTVNADTAGQTFTCTATSAGGTNSATASVKRDTAGPSVVFGGNAGTYQLGDTVAITCTASDALSGLATPANCGGVSGVAWSLGAGSHTVTRTATDVAGNSTTQSTTYTVAVTAAGLCQLVKQWSDNAGVANSLCVKIDKNNMAPFRNELAAQRGKHIPADKADILSSLSLGL